MWYKTLVHARINKCTFLYQLKGKNPNLKKKKKNIFLLNGPHFFLMNGPHTTQTQIFRFPNITTKSPGQEALKALSNDIRARCSHRIEELTRYSKGDLPSVRAANINGYSGNCSNCPNASLVCSGVDEGWSQVGEISIPANTRYHTPENGRQ